MTKFSIFSKALYSSWCHVPQYNILFDCGEGCATSIGNYLAGIEFICLTHFHGDHVLGLPSVVGCRNSGRGISRNRDTLDHNKPLTVYYPVDNDASDLINFVMSRNGNWLRYKLEFVPISVGFELDLGNKQTLRAISMSHQKNKSTLGYVIYEKRSRLKEQFRDKDIPRLIASGVKKDELNETYRANLFAYCLDAYKINEPEQLLGVKDIIMDCTFMSEEDRDDPTHFTLDEAYNFYKEVKGVNMYGAHLSGRYNFNKIVDSNKDSVIKFINPYKVNDL
jgi:ribonuclease Z